MRLTIAAILAAAFLWGTSGRGALAQDVQGQPQGQPAGQGQPPAPIVFGTGDQSFDPNQPIKPGFSLSVTVSSAAGPETDLTGVFQVDPTGAIQMKLVGRVEVRGLTPIQASDKIAALLKPYIRDPKVTVAIVSVPKPVIFLSGGVMRPGAIPVNEGTTLAELLTVLGFSDMADLSHVRVVHKDEQGNRSISEYNFLRWLKPGPGEKPDESQNPVLTDRDLVYVPLKVLPGTGNVSVEGDVLRPGMVTIRVGVPTTLREVVSLAGGPNATADRRQVSIRRIGVERPVIVDYDRMEQGDPIHNIVVQPDDVVYVQKLDLDMYINVNGAFVRSGKLPYEKAMTLTQLIGDAGGLVPNAKEAEGRVFRHVGGNADPTRTQIIAFNYKKIRRNEQPDITLLPGDTVEIPHGNPPRPPMDPFQITTALLTIAVLVDRLASRNGTGF